MADSIVRKKGGDSRYVLDQAPDMTTFMVPAGFGIKAITAKRLNATASNIQIGNYVPGVYEVITFDMGTTSSATVGDFTVTIRGEDTSVTVAGTESSEELADAIYAALAANSAITADWEVYQAAEVVTVKANVAEARTGTNEIANDTSTFTAGDSTVVVTATGAIPTAGEQLVAAAALTATAGAVDALTMVTQGPLSWTADTKMGIELSDAGAASKIYIQLQQFN